MMLPLLFSSEGGALPGPFSPTAGLTFWTLIVFVAVLVILTKFVFPMIVSANVEREQLIKQQLAEAKQLHADAQAALEEQRQLLAEARGEATALIAEARAAGDRERVLAVEKTRAEQDEMLTRARLDIDAQRVRAVADLRREAVDLAISAAGKVVGHSFEGAADRKLVEDYLASLGKSS